MIVSFLSFILLLSVLVLAHEWGHYFAGRRMGIGVERFALGFGRAIFKKTINGVEWRINWIPFGGYVKFVGDEPDKPVPEELRHIAFNTAAPYKRAITAFAGPAMNVVLAFVLFCIIFLAGNPVPTSYIGDVDPDGVAAKAGLLAGDRVVAIDGKPISFWQDLADAITENPDRHMVLTVDRDGSLFDLPVTPERVTQMSLFGFDTEQGSLGIAQSGQKPLVGVVGPQTPAYEAGIRTGDLILSVNGKPVRFLSELDGILAAQDHQALNIAVARGIDEIVAAEPKTALTAALPERAAEEPGWSMATLGIATGETFLNQITEDSPAAKAGLQPGDQIAAINGAPIAEWGDITEPIQKSADQTLTITVVRNGEKIDLTATPEKKESRDMIGNVQTFGYLGIVPYTLYTAVDIGMERYYNPIKILQRGWQESWRWTVVTMKGFFYLIIGKAPAKSLGGPILIAQLAGESARMGWIPFMFLLAVISLNLAFINLFPIPILDGGHLLLLAIEGVRGKPISDRFIGIAQYIGVTLLGSLILLVFYNDLSRVWLDIKGYFLQ